MINLAVGILLFAALRATSKELAIRLFGARPAHARNQSVPTHTS
jgi:hypothetical protein